MTIVAKLGRTVAFTWNGAAVLGIREKGLTVNGEAIDITSDENGGWRTLLDTAGQMSVDLHISGVTKDQRFLGDLFAGSLQRAVTLTYASGAILSGTFQVVSVSETHPYKDAQTFEAQLQSTGTVAFTPAP